MTSSFFYFEKYICEMFYIKISAKEIRKCFFNKRYPKPNFFYNEADTFACFFRV